MSTILKTKNLTKIYGTKFNTLTALDNVNFEINKGEFVGIMGPSGAGKSTLLNVISTIDTPTTGTIYFEKENISQLKGNQLSDFRKQNLGFIFQDFNLLDTLTVKENMILPLSVSNMPYKEIEKRVAKTGLLLGITDILNKYPFEISGGQKQRTAAGRAIIHQPGLILADEPTGALDSKSATELLNCLSDLNTHHHATILLVTHDPFAASYCSRIMFIKDGRMYSEIYSNGNRKSFYTKVIEMLAALGGGIHDVL